jgi:hypothetical protein
MAPGNRVDEGAQGREGLLAQGQAGGGPSGEALLHLCVAELVERGGISFQHEVEGAAGHGLDGIDDLGLQGGLEAEEHLAEALHDRSCPRGLAAEDHLTEALERGLLRRAQLGRLGGGQGEARRARQSDGGAGGEQASAGEVQARLRRTA